MIGKQWVGRMWHCVLCQERDTTIRVVPVSLAPHFYVECNFIHVSLGNIRGLKQLSYISLVHAVENIISGGCPAKIAFW
jgi:hypothetical protein